MRQLLRSLRWTLLGCLAGMVLMTHVVSAGGAESEAIWRRCRERGEVFADCGRNAQRLLRGWIEQKQDPQSGLFSRGGRWDYHNEAADHYSSLVLMAHYLDAALIRPGGALHRTVLRQRELCSTPEGLPVTFDLRPQTRAKPATFEALAEWLRDGLIRIAEVLGRDNDWYREMERLVDAMLAAPDRWHRELRTTEGRGNMLQTLARLHAMPGKPHYLAAAEQLADAVLLGSQPPPELLIFGDHGCELVPGLAELFVLECKLRRPKAASYREPLRRLLDGILASGAHPVSGLFCNSKGTGADRQWQQPPDTWGYVLFAYENYDRGTGGDRYRAAIEKPLRWLIENRPDYSSLKRSLWPRSDSSDDWSDSHESMIVLWNRYPQTGDGFGWLDWATRQHVHRSDGDRAYGPYTGGHFDGSVGRTLCAQMMLCPQGVHCVPFVEGVRLGGYVEDDALWLTLETDKAWRGTLSFDGLRGEHPTATTDWARINEMPQWFVVRPQRKYRVTLGSDAPLTMTGAELIGGLRLDCAPGTRRKIRVAVREPAEP